MDDFLRLEYEQCLALIKYYDERLNDLVKFASGLSAAVPSVVFAFNGLGGRGPSYFWQFVGFASTAAMLSLWSVFTALVQNRLYFTYAARQVNAIRRRMVIESGFENNRMYTDDSFPAFKWRSAHTVLYGFVCLQASLFLAVTVFALLQAGMLFGWAILISLASALLVGSFAIWRAATYLSNRGRLSADEGVHGAR